MRVRLVSGRAGGLSLAVVLSAAAMLAADAKSDGNVDPRARSEMIDYVLNGLNGWHVFSGAAGKTSDEVRERVPQGEYEAITGAREFGGKVTADPQRSAVTNTCVSGWQGRAPECG